MRYSVRAYKSQPVAEETLRCILEYARFAASSKNMQPWKVFAVSGDSLKNLSKDMIAAFRSGNFGPAPRDERGDIPAEYWDRARQCGFGLFELKSIAREDKEARQKHYEENYHFFGAPLELFFAIHKGMPQRQLIDMGIFLERVMHKAHEEGLSCCPQASVSDFPGTLQKHLPLEAGEEVLFGLSLGYEEEGALVNSYRTERLGVDDFTTWLK